MRCRTRNDIEPQRGSPFTTAGFARMVERAAASAGLELKAHPHMFRHAWRRMRGLLDGFSDQMLHFTAEAYGRLAVHEAWDEFTGFDSLEFDPNTPLMQLFMPWFFNCWAPDPVATLVSGA